MAVEFRTIIILIPRKETNVHAYITTLWVLFHCSFPTQLFNSNVLEYLQSKQLATIGHFSMHANRQIDNVEACIFFLLLLLPGISRQQTIFLRDLRFLVQWFDGSINL